MCILVLTCRSVALYVQISEVGVSSRFCFVGGGNMASAIIGGLIASGVKPEKVTVVDPSDEQRAQLTAQFGVHATEDVGSASNDADIIVLAVKPQIMSLVAGEISSAVDLNGKLIVSVAAGLTLSTLQNLFGDVAIARTMPNTPALLGMGATGLYCNDKTSEAQLAQAVELVEAFGICVQVDKEELLDAVTAVSGSGPAYYFLMIEEMIKAGMKLGLSNQAATELTLQTALGAASMAAMGEGEPSELRRRVTSPNGTTHAAITSMQENGYGEIIEKAMIACRDRAVELGKQ